MTRSHTTILHVLPVFAVAGMTAGVHAEEIHSGSAADATGLAPIVDGYRTALGDLNAPNPGSVGTGRRQIDWDAAPDAVSAPNFFPGDFFNFGAFPRARGVVFTTEFDLFQLSATAASGEGVEFSNIEPTYKDTFGFFSAERLFTPLGNNVVEVSFKVPGVDRDALSTGFGAVFTDVDLENVTSMEFFDRWGGSLGLYYVEAGSTWNSDESLSFLGVKFDEAIVAKVRITCGNALLQWQVTEAQSGVDLVAMDDFIFGEPIPADAIAGDTNNDGLVNVIDLLDLLGSYGWCPGCPADFNGDDMVDIIDLLALLANFD